MSSWVTTRNRSGVIILLIIAAVNCGRMIGRAFVPHRRMIRASNRFLSSSSYDVARVMKEAYNEMNQNNIPEAEESVIHLGAAALELPWETGYRELREILLTHRSTDMQMSTKQYEHFMDLVTRRTETLEPIQYLVGRWDFLSYTFTIVPPLLCPRPETEELVLHTGSSIQKIQRQGTVSKVRILDIGCGTGCIGVSLIAEYDNCCVHALDIEPIAVDVSLQNAKEVLSDERIKYYSAEQCAIADFSRGEHSDRFDLVVSNPPYIPSTTDDLEPTVKNFESPQALYGGGLDGMEVIREIVDQLPYVARLNATCWLEVDPSQPMLIQEELENNSNVQFVQSLPDLMGNERFVKLSVTSVQER